MGPCLNRGCGWTYSKAPHLGQYGCKVPSTLVKLHLGVERLANAIALWWALWALWATGQPCEFDPPEAHKAHPHVILPFLRQMRSWDLELVCLLLSTLAKWSRRSPCFVHHFWIRVSFTLTLLLQGLTLFLLLHSLLIWSPFQFVLLSWFQVFLFLLPSLFSWLCIPFSMLQIFFLWFSSIPCHSYL